MSTANGYTCTVSKRFDGLFWPVFFTTGVIYFIIFFGIISLVDTTGPDREKLKKENIAKAARKITVTQVVEKPEENVISDEGQKEEEKTEEEKVVEENVTQETKQAVRKSAEQIRREAEKRKEIRAQRRAEQQARIKAKAAARMKKIQAKSRVGSSASSDAYSSYSGTGGSGAGLAEKLSKSGGVGVGTSGSGGLGRSEGGGVSVGTGSIDDFLSGTDFGELTEVEGVDDKNFKVSPLQVRDGGDGGRNQGEINRAIDAKTRTLVSCIKRARNRYQTLRGSLIFSITIKPDGRVTNIKIIKSSWSNKAGGRIVEKCIRSSIRVWKFPQSTGGDITIEKPIIFG